MEHRKFFSYVVVKMALFLLFISVLRFAFLPSVTLSFGGLRKAPILCHIRAISVSGVQTCTGTSKASYDTLQK